MTSDEPLRCLHCDQTKAEIKRKNTFCGIVSGYEYVELEAEWPKHRWADWKDHELPKFILPEFRDEYRRTQITQFEYLPCEHTTIGHKPADQEAIDLRMADRVGQCVFCGKQDAI